MAKEAEGVARTVEAVGRSGMGYPWPSRPAPPSTYCCGGEPRVPPRLGL